MTSAGPATYQTAPGLYHGWMSTPNGRGTTDLLWSSLSTIFLCVWTAIHSPLPYYRKEKFKRSENWRKWSRQNVIASKIFPALFSVIVPELMVITAVGDSVSAHKIIKDCHSISNRHLSITHGFFLNMGGFCLRSPSGRFHQLQYKDLLVLGNIESKATSGPDDANTTAESIVAPTTEAWIRELEKFSEDDINALSKADSLTKMIACFQTLWFVTQVLSRLGENQAVTLLEVSTCAYVFSAFVAYAAWWKKPQNCSIPLMIDCSDEVIAKLPRSDYERIEGSWEEFIWNGARWNTPFDDDSSHRLGWLMLAYPIFFGAIHAASWNTVLPSVIELWMWRSSAVICIGIVILYYLVLSFAFLIERLFSMKEDHMFIALVTLFPVLLYIVARLFMIVEVFVSLRALPLSAYDSISWSDAVPHI